MPFVAVNDFPRVLRLYQLYMEVMIAKDMNQIPHFSDGLIRATKEP